MTGIFDASLIERQSIACALFTQALHREKLAHAYLLAGRAVADKWLIARELAAYMNCERLDRDTSCLVGSPDNAALLCQSCRWIGEEKHPQAFIVLDDKATKGGKIPVERARAVAEELSKTSNYHRVIVVPDACEDVFHRPAANALLKTIEEPASPCIFFFLAVHQEDVLPTITSRCQVITLFNPCRGADAAIRDNDLADHASQAQDLIKQALAPPFSPQGGDGGHPVAQSLELAAALQGLLERDNSPASIVDLVVHCEVDAYRALATEDDLCCRYLKQLLALAELTKEQLRHFVQPRWALETFALSRQRLLAQIQGEGIGDQA